MKVLKFIGLLVIVFVLLKLVNGGDSSPTATPSASTTYTVVPPRQPDPHEKIDLKFIRWEKGGFGSIGLVWLQFKNNNAYPVKDLSVRCNFAAPSGTNVSTVRKTIYVAIPPGKTVKSGEINLGFIDQQSSGASCLVYDAVQAGAAVEAVADKPKPAPAPAPKPKGLKGVY